MAVSCARAFVAAVMARVVTASSGQIFSSESSSPRMTSSARMR
jgi:hypothetical protein